jgi:hypothetical protein
VTHGDQDKDRYREDHAQGWERHLGELLDHVASKSLEAAP